MQEGFISCTAASHRGASHSCGQHLVMLKPNISMELTSKHSRTFQILKALRTIKIKAFKFFTQTTWIFLYVSLCPSVYVSVSVRLLQHVDDLVELQSGGDIQWRLSILQQKKRRRSEAGGGSADAVLMWFSTYIVSNVGVAVSLQQQRYQTMTLPLTDIMKSCVALLHTRHKTR